jgi:hypothetical protein
MKKTLCLLLLLSIILVSCIDDPIEKEFFGYWTEITSENQPSPRLACLVPPLPPDIIPEPGRSPILDLDLIPDVYTDIITLPEWLWDDIVIISDTTTILKRTYVGFFSYYDI